MTLNEALHTQIECIYSFIRLLLYIVFDVDKTTSQVSN